jgi:hypothetical protein
MPAPERCFGLEMTRHLVAAQVSLTELRKRLMRRGYQVSLNHVSDISRAERAPTPQFISAFAKVMELPKDDTRRLMRAACLDRGYDIGGL